MSIWIKLKDFLKNAKNYNIDIDGILMIKLPYEGVDVNEVRIKNNYFVCPMCLKKTEDFDVCCEKCHKNLGYNRSLEK